MRVLADKDKCVGAGTCVGIAPDLFDQNDADGIVVVLAERFGEERLATVQEAVDFCPAQALLLSTDD
jgi:ferredoxin